MRWRKSPLDREGLRCFGRIPASRVHNRQIIDKLFPVGYSGESTSGRVPGIPFYPETCMSRPRITAKSDSGVPGPSLALRAVCSVFVAGLLLCCLPTHSRLWPFPENRSGPKESERLAAAASANSPFAASGQRGVLDVFAGAGARREGAAAAVGANAGPIATPDDRRDARTRLPPPRRRRAHPKLRGWSGGRRPGPRDVRTARRPRWPTSAPRAPGKTSSGH